MKLKQLAARAAGSSSGLLLATLASFSATAFLSRSLSPAAYSAIILAMSTALILSQVAQLGLMRTGIRLVAEYRLRSDAAELKSFLVFAFLAVALVSVVLALGVGNLFGVVFTEGSFVPGTGLLAALLIWPFAVSRLASGVLIGQNRPRFGSFFQSGIPNLGILLAVVSASVALDTGLGAHGSLVVLLGAYVVTFAGLGLLLPSIGDLRGVQRAPFRPRAWLVISLPLMLLGLMQIANRQASVLVIGAFGESGDVARFFPAFRISDLATFGLLAVNAAIAPRIAEASSSGDRESLQCALHSAALLSLGSTVVLVAAILCLQSHFFSFFGGVAEDGERVLLILLVGQIVNAATGSVSLLMTMSGQEKFVASVSTGMTIVHVLTQVPLVAYYGIEGAAAGMAATSGLWNLILLHRAKSRLGVNPTVFSRMGPGRPGHHERYRQRLR